MNNINLEEISIKHKPVFDKAREQEGLFNGDFCFGNLYGWGKVFNTRVCLWGGMYASLAEISSEDMLIGFPLGDGDKKAFVYSLKEYAEGLGKTPVLGLLNPDLKEKAEKLFGSEIELVRRRNSDDYIYFTEDLISLSGPELHSKKNMLNSFLKSKYLYEEISEKNIQAAHNFCLAKAFTDDEKIVIDRMFEDFYALGFKGAVIKIHGEIIAATVAEKNRDTVIIHIEKAEKDVRGAYAAINNLFLKNSMSDTLFVNREDDMGLANLRKAKLSYKPCRMEEKFLGKFI